MKKKEKHTTVFELDTKNPPPLTEEQKAELKALAKMPEEEIDYSDIPPIDESLLEKAARGELYRPVKCQLTLRLDKDVLIWQKAKGKGYQSRINKILRQAMMAEMQRRKSL